jgi:hypothetical protein
MVTCHLNFQFQVLALLKGTKDLGVAHFIVDVPSLKAYFEKNMFGVGTSIEKSFLTIVLEFVF